jgi:hypothetical protein
MIATLLRLTVRGIITMLKINSLSFRVKLIAIFSGFAVLALTLCVIGYFVLGQAANLDRETYEQQIVPTAQISNIIENILKINGCVDMMLLELDEEGAFEQYHAEIKELKTQTIMLLDEFIPHTAEEKAVFDEASRIFKTTFMPATEQVFILIEAEKVETKPLCKHPEKENSKASPLIASKS